MHLGIEAVGMKHSGGAVVLLDVVRAALRATGIDHVTVFCSPAKTRRFSFPASPRLAEIELDHAEHNPLARVRWLTAGLRRASSEKGLDVLLTMSGIGFATVPTVAFVQQSLPMCQEALDKCDWKTKLRMAMIGTLMKSSAREAALVVTQTPTMRQWTRDQFGVPEDRIVVTEPWGDATGMEEGGHSGVEAMLATPAGQRILYVGNTSPYKNVGGLIEAMQFLREEFPKATLFLTCAPSHPLCRAPGVVGLGYLGGSDLAASFSHASIFATASLVESGNLTLVEAMLAGTCIAASDRPFARDLCGAAATYFDPQRPESIANALALLSRDGDLRNNMGLRGQQLAISKRELRPYDRLIATILGVGTEREVRKQ